MPEGLQIQPVPTQISIGQAMQPDGKLGVVLTFQTPQGVNGFFLGDGALEIGEQIVRLAKAGKTGLLMPNGQPPQPPPNLRGL